MQPAPLPLSDAQALEHAMRLREQHRLSYPAISEVLGVYHGQWWAQDTWRRRLRTSGAVPKQRGQRTPATTDVLENL